MSDQSSLKLPVWFWVIAGVALVWNLIGVGSYIGQVTINEEALAAMPAAERALMEGMPAWLTGLFAIAVFTGVAGCILLLLRKQLATPVFTASLAAIIVQMSYWLFFTSSLSVYGVMKGASMPIMVIMVGAFLLWFSNSAKGKGWLS